MKRFTYNVQTATLLEDKEGEYIKVTDMVDVLRTLVHRNTLDSEGVRIIIDELVNMGVGNGIQN